MWTRLTFYSLRERCCVAIVELTPCPYLLLTHFPGCCCLTWVVKVLFFYFLRLSVVRSAWRAWSLSSFHPSDLTSSLKPICVLHELSLLSSAAPPLHKTPTIYPLNVFQLSYCPSWQTTNKQPVIGIFLTLSLPVFTHSCSTHTPATSSYTCAKLFGFIVTEQNTRSSGALMHCQLLHVLRKLLHLVPQEPLHTFITRCSVPGGCLCKSSFP